MKAFILTTIAIALLSSCATLSPDVRGSLAPVWTQSGPPPSHLAVPRGFRVTPAEARQFAALSGTWPNGTAAHLYRDQEYYYLVSPTERTTRNRAFKVNGVTGQVVYPQVNRPRSTTTIGPNESMGSRIQRRRQLR